MIAGCGACADNPADFAGGRLGGTYLEYPTREQVGRFMREVPYDQRLSVLSQGFRVGASYEHFYTIEKFAKSLLRRKANAPALGIRELDCGEVVPWIRDVIGDRDLANAVDGVFDRAGDMPTVVDEVRIIVVLRIDQYHEVLNDFADRY